MDSFYIYNTLTRTKEEFKPIHPPHVGLYVCGPTVYGDPHLGHARSAMTFDILYRWLKTSGYKVRYVRNITDVGHLVNDADSGEDKIGKFARLQNLEPMEVVQYYTNRYHEMLGRMNMLNPSIEPTATGHIPEQIEMTAKLIAQGFAYESNGSVYFDVRKYNEKFKYGALSGRTVEEMEAGYRDLDGQDEKRFPADFALWKKASPEHLMKWQSPWSEGFPGWHIECTVMSTKYLGRQYDIHGGGMDLIFPHHEAEIAQSNACIGDPHSHELNEARYWMHNNMITYSGQKMGKSLGNAIGLEEFFTGNHPLLEQAYSPMTIRFFMLQAHYGGTLDFSNEALKASEKAFQRLSEAFVRLNLIKPETLPEKSTKEFPELAKFEGNVRGFMNDDLNTPKVIAALFDTLATINEISIGKNPGVSSDQLILFRNSFNLYFTDVLGLKADENAASVSGKTEELMQLMIALRKEVREAKNFALSDRIRDGLTAIEIKIKDTPQGTEWYVES